MTDTPTGLTGPAVPDNPILEYSASNNLEHDRVDVAD
jgi:hypothetical protein